MKLHFKEANKREITAETFQSPPAQHETNEENKWVQEKNRYKGNAKEQVGRGGTDSQQPSQEPNQQPINKDENGVRKRSERAPREYQRHK